MYLITQPSFLMRLFYPAPKTRLLSVFFAFLSLSLQSQAQTSIPTNGLIAYYPFNGNANDASGNGNNGAVQGATLVQDRRGTANGAYRFLDGARIVVSNSPSLTLNKACTVQLSIVSGVQWRSIRISHKILFWLARFLAVILPLLGI
jgi:hypothetical protein